MMFVVVVVVLFVLIKRSTRLFLKTTVLFLHSENHSVANFAQVIKLKCEREKTLKSRQGFRELNISNISQKSSGPGCSKAD